MEEQLTYAHNDTSVPERVSRTASLNRLRVSAEVERLRRAAHERRIPVASDETLGFLQTLALAKNAKNILEVGSAEGITALALLEICRDAHITTIERDERFYCSARKNLNAYVGRTTLLHGDAAQTLETLPDASYDFIFLDCAKVQYIKLLPRLKALLKTNGVLVADDVLLYGWVNGESPVPKKRRMLVEHVREFIAAVTEDSQLSTCILDIGDGIALSVKKYD